MNTDRRERRERRERRVIEFYAGIGGMRCGLMMSGEEEKELEEELELEYFFSFFFVKSFCSTIKGFPFVIVRSFDLNTTANEVYVHNFHDITSTVTFHVKFKCWNIFYFFPL